MFGTNQTRLVIAAVLPCHLPTLVSPGLINSVTVPQRRLHFHSSTNVTTDIVLCMSITLCVEMAHVGFGGLIISLAQDTKPPRRDSEISDDVRDISQLQTSKSVQRVSSSTMAGGQEEGATVWRDYKTNCSCNTTSSCTVAL